MTFVHNQLQTTRQNNTPNFLFAFENPEFTSDLIGQQESYKDFDWMFVSDLKLS